MKSLEMPLTFCLKGTNKLFYSVRFISVIGILIVMRVNLLMKFILLILLNNLRFKLKFFNIFINNYINNKYGLFSAEN